MHMEARVEPLTGSPPSISWRWDPETDILSGAFKGNRKRGGLTGTVELTDDEGSVAVLDVNNGVICGMDVVVWPEVATRGTESAGATHRRAGGASRPALPGRDGLGGGGHFALGEDQLDGERRPRADRRGSRRGGRAGRGQLLHRSGSRAGWRGSGWPTCRRSRPSKRRCRQKSQRLSLRSTMIRSATQNAHSPGTGYLGPHESWGTAPRAGCEGPHSPRRRSPRPAGDAVRRLACAAATLVEGSVLGRLPVGPPEPWGETVAFLDGVQRSELMIAGLLFRRPTPRST